MHIYIYIYIYIFTATHCSLFKTQLNMTWPHGLLLFHARAKATRMPDQCPSLAMSWGRPLLLLLRTGSGGRHDDTYNTLAFLSPSLSSFAAAAAAAASLS